MQPVGFEPTPPKRMRPKRTALDHSAKTAYKYNIKNNQLKVKKYMFKYVFFI